VLIFTVDAYWVAALRTGERMSFTSSRIAAISTGESNTAALNGVLASSVSLWNH